MKRNFILICMLLCFCLCITSCSSQARTPVNTDVLENQTTAPTETPDSQKPTEAPKQPISPPAKPLRASNEPYIFNDETEPNGGGRDFDYLRAFVDGAYLLGIPMDIVGYEIVLEYLHILNNDYKMGIQYMEVMPALYLVINHFDITLDEILESPSAYHPSYTFIYEELFFAPEYDYKREYSEEFWKAMFLPYDEMIMATLSPKGAYLDGKVHNIQTLNELFENDKKAFARINLEDLVAYQERLEENGIDFGFNEEMVKFANENCRRSGS